MVALTATAGDEGVGTGGDGGAGQVLELAHLVAAAGDAGEVVVLDPEDTCGQPEGGAQAVGGDRRRGQVGERRALGGGGDGVRRRW